MVQAIGIRCLKCGKITQSIEPVIIKKINNEKYKITIDCAVCKKPKNRTLNKTQVALLPDEIKESPDNSVFADKIERNGRVVPILPILGAIASGVAALSGVAGIVASNVIQAKKNENEQKETERHNRALEDAARGKGTLFHPEGGIEEEKQELPKEKEITDERVLKYIKTLNGMGFIFV